MQFYARRGEAGGYHFDLRVRTKTQVGAHGEEHLGPSVFGSESLPRLQVQKTGPDLDQTLVLQQDPSFDVVDHPGLGGDHVLRKSRRGQKECGGGFEQRFHKAPEVCARSLLEVTRSLTLPAKPLRLNPHSCQNNMESFPVGAM